MREYREFLRGYREYFEKVKRDYKERVKIFKDILILSKISENFYYREFLREF